MTNEMIEHIIDLINTGNPHDQIFLRPLSKNVLVGRVRIENTQGNICKDKGYDMFFIQNSEKLVVAAVLNMNISDLHVFVKKEHRKKGYLVKALKEVILPYLFSTGREEQQITFRDEQAKDHAINAGFHILSDKAAVIYPKDIPSMPIVHRGKTQRTGMAGDFLRIAQDDFETAFDDNEIIETLDYLAHEVTNVVSRVKDTWLDCEQSS